MKIIFFGTADFAVAALAALLRSQHHILAVVTVADKRRGRGLNLHSSPVKMLAEHQNLAILQPEDLTNADFLKTLEKEKADLFAVCAYGKILTKKVLQIPQRLAINLHASLLPKYRGAAPLNWAIIQGERQTGVTVFKMDEFMDKGKIILQRATPILPADTALSLAERLSGLGAQALVEAVDLIAQDKAHFTAQDEAAASYAPKLKKADGLINWKASAGDIAQRIRGLVPWPGGFTYFQGKLLKIWQAEIVSGGADKEAGEIVEIDRRNGILVQAGKDRLLLTVLQLEDKRKMSAQEFILGQRIKVGEKLGRSK